jgi:GntR family transcriptional regulator
MVVKGSRFETSERLDRTGNEAGMAGPKYRHIAEELRAAITSGQLKPGAQLPAEPELMEQYGVSRGTVRLALAELSNAGLVTPLPGRGTFVRERVMLDYRASSAERSDRPESEQTDAYIGEVRAAGRDATQSFDMRLEPASAEVASRLQIDESALVVVRHCMRYVDGQPWSDQHSYYPMSVAERAGLNVPSDLPQGTIRAMADAGLTEIGHVDEITARMPTPEEVRSLDLGMGVPILVYNRIAYTDTQPVRFTRTVFPADRNRLLYEMGALDALDGTAT